MCDSSVVLGSQITSSVNESSAEMDSRTDTEPLIDNLFNALEPCDKHVKDHGLSSFQPQNLVSFDPRQVSDISFENCNLKELVGRFTALKAILDEHAPFNTKIIKPKASKPLFTDEILSARKTRRQLERKWMKSKTHSDRQKYCDQRCLVNEMVDKAKTMYYSALVRDCSGDQKKLFNIINNLLHHSKYTVPPSSVSNQALAHKFSVFFENKIQNIRSSFAQNHLSDATGDSNVIGAEEIARSILLSEFDPASEVEISDIVRSSPLKSCRLDPIPTSLIKSCHDTLVPIITNIVNKSLENGFLGKIIEKVVSKRLLAHVKEHTLLDSLQSAYKAHHSTETALLRVSNDILCAMDDGKLTALVLLDLSAAFDTVDHNVLLRRLSTHIGVEGLALEWCRSYLTNRRQHVCIGDAFSKESSFNFAVPKGSVLKPQWFNIYILAFRDIICKYNLSYHVYADDTQIYLSFKPYMAQLNLPLESLENCILELRLWMKQNFLKLKDNKTEYIHWVSPTVGETSTE
ncbi:uncharacterized protein LOC117106926 [Anneissia japonica]|uniref:uncharacterized protein LOC117106926 n=1 Tax=Anneissia japonica TaxID=1529436 RepID=UPI00142562B0|nr:uncharacterized protein LOC117106926 [Anneissia japonica]